MKTGFSKISKKLIPLYQLTLILGSVAAPNLYAQPVQERATSLEEVVVTAGKRETNLLETAYAVSAFDQDSLDRQGIKNAVDLSGLVPSLQVGISPEDSGVQITIRGVTSNNFTELGDPTVAFHFDGLYSPRPQGGLALMHDVERVEISRGPQGTLYGRNSTAGSINVISARPQFDEQTSNLNFEMAQRNGYTTKGWFNVPLSDTMAIRASFLYDRADSWLNQQQDFYDFSFNGVAPPGDFPGFRQRSVFATDNDYTQGGDVPLDGIPNVDQRRNYPVGRDGFYNATDRHAYRLSFRWQPSDDFEWNVIYDYFEDNSPGGLLIKDCEKAAKSRGNARYDFSCEGNPNEGDYYAPVNVTGRLDLSIKSWRSIIEWKITDGIVMEHRLAFAEQNRYQLSDGYTAYPDPDHPALGIRQVTDDFTNPRATFADRLLQQNPELLAELGHENVVVPFFNDLQFETRDSNYESRVMELQFKSDHDGQLQWIAGLFYLKENNSIHFNVENPFNGDGLLTLAQAFVQPDRTLESKALFAQVDFALTQKLNLTFGARYSEDEKEDKGGSNHITSAHLAPNPNQYFSRPANLGTPLTAVGVPDLVFAPPIGNTYTFVGRGTIFFYDTVRSPNPQLLQSSHLTYSDGTLADDFHLRVPGTDNTTRGEWDKTTWKLGFDYQYSDDIFVYGSASSGYKSGGFGDVVDICDCGITTNSAYDPEEVITYELGMKGKFFDDSLILLANVFFSQFDEMQQTYYAEFTPSGMEVALPEGHDTIFQEAPCTADPSRQCVTTTRSIGGQITDNIAEAEIFGIEFEFDWRPYETGRVYGWINYLDTEIVDYGTLREDNYMCLERALLGYTPCPTPNPDVTNENGNPARVTSVEGNKLTWSPEWSFVVNYEHNWYLPHSYILSPHITVRWTDEMFFSIDNFDEGALHQGQDEVWTVDASLRLINQDNQWAVELFGRNLTDEMIRLDAAPGPGYQRANFAAPRTYGVRLNIYF